MNLCNKYGNCRTHCIEEVREEFRVDGSGAVQCAGGEAFPAVLRGRWQHSQRLIDPREEQAEPLGAKKRKEGDTGKV